MPAPQHLTQSLLNQFQQHTTPTYKLPKLYKSFHLQVLSQLHIHWKSHTALIQAALPERIISNQRKNKLNQQRTPHRNQKATQWHTARKINLKQQKIMFVSQGNSNRRGVTRADGGGGDGDGGGDREEDDGDSSSIPYTRTGLPPE